MINKSVSSLRRSGEAPERLRSRRASATLEPRIWVLVKGRRLLAAGFTKSEAERAAKERALVAVTAAEYLAPEGCR